MAVDGSLKFDTKINTDGFNKGVASIGKMVSGVGSRVAGLGKAFTPVTAAVVGVGATAGKTAIDFTKLYESTMVVFEKMLGGKQAADELYSSLLSIAKASTFSQEAFLTAGKKLVGMGIDAQSTTKYMQAITDAVAGFGGTSENLTNVAENFAKISTAGKLSMEDVNMLSDNGIQALKILGNQYGKTTDEIRNGYNHMIVAGKGEMSSRNVFHLYAWPDGSIRREQYYRGIDERVYIYENTSTETAEVEEKAREEFLKIMNRKEFGMNTSALSLAADIGDILGGRDYLTGVYMAKPITNIIYTTDDDGTVSVEYQLEGED